MAPPRCSVWSLSVTTSKVMKSPWPSRPAPFRVVSETSGEPVMRRSTPFVVRERSGAFPLRGLRQHRSAARGGAVPRAQPPLVVPPRSLVGRAYRFARFGVPFRWTLCTRSRGRGADSSAAVVRMRRPRTSPTMPSRRIRRSTVQRASLWPLRKSFLSTCGVPGMAGAVQTPGPRTRSGHSTRPGAAQSPVGLTPAERGARGGTR
jgi:hypothetical protein